MPDDATADGATSLLDRVHGCLIGGLIGDAMGTPSEGLEPDEIDAGFGWIEDFAGDGTDDSIMKYLLADALIATDGNADADSWATQWLSQRSKISACAGSRRTSRAMPCLISPTTSTLRNSLSAGTEANQVATPRSGASFRISDTTLVSSRKLTPRPPRHAGQAGPIG